jgi:hypothetical protein
MATRIQVPLDGSPLPSGASNETAETRAAEDRLPEGNTDSSGHATCKSMDHGEERPSAGDRFGCAPLLGLDEGPARTATLHRRVEDRTVSARFHHRNPRNTGVAMTQAVAAIVDRIRAARRKVPRILAASLLHCGIAWRAT